MYGSHGFGFIGSFLRLAQVAVTDVREYTPGSYPVSLWGLDIIDLIGLLVRYGRASEIGIGTRDCYCNCRTNIYLLIALHLPVLL